MIIVEVARAPSGASGESGDNATLIGQRVEVNEDDKRHRRIGPG
jgi:hypothetical protein